MFRFGLRDRHVEDRISPPIRVRYPPGSVELEDGTVVQNVDAALDMARAVRAGGAWPSPRSAMRPRGDD